MPRVIITVQGKNPQPYRFQLDRKVVSLGRGSDNDIVIDSGSVSGKHAEMHRIEGCYELSDLGSTNGIKNEGVRQQVVRLHSGMSVKLGDVAFDFTLTEDELDTLALEKPAIDSPVSRETGVPLPKLPVAEPEIRSQTRIQAAEVFPAAASQMPGIGIILLFLFLASAAFYTGLEIRHRKETGESLLKGIVNKSDAVEVVPEEKTEAE